MPVGSDGETRPADVIAKAVLVMRVATGETEETCVNSSRRSGEPKAGAARPGPERRVPARSRHGGNRRPVGDGEGASHAER